MPKSDCSTEQCERAPARTCTRIYTLTRTCPLLLLHVYVTTCVDILVWGAVVSGSRAVLRNQRPDFDSLPWVISVENI